MVGMEGEIGGDGEEGSGMAGVEEEEGGGGGGGGGPEGASCGEGGVGPYTPCGEGGVGPYTPSNSAPSTTIPDAPANTPIVGLCRISLNSAIPSKPATIRDACKIG